MFSKGRMPPIISKVNINFGNAMKTLIKQIQRFGFCKLLKVVNLYLIPPMQLFCPKADTQHTS